MSLKVTSPAGVPVWSRIRPVMVGPEGRVAVIVWSAVTLTGVVVMVRRSGRLVGGVMSSCVPAVGQRATVGVEPLAAVRFVGVLVLPLVTGRPSRVVRPLMTGLLLEVLTWASGTGWPVGSVTVTVRCTGLGRVMSPVLVSAVSW